MKYILIGFLLSISGIVYSQPLINLTGKVPMDRITPAPKVGEILGYANGKWGAVDLIGIYPTVQDTTFATEVGKWYFVDVTSSVVEVDAPTNPIAGNWFKVTDAYQNAATFNITVDIQNTSKLCYGTLQDVIINENGRTITLTYISDAIGWVFE